MTAVKKPLAPVRWGTKRPPAPLAWTGPELAELKRLADAGGSWPAVGLALGRAGKTCRAAYYRNFGPLPERPAPRPGPMTDEQRGLVETHYRLIWLLVRRAQALGPALERMETEELVQRACLWACRHALTFDALKGAFGTRVGWAVRGAMTEATDRKGQPALTNHDFGWTPQSARPVGARLDDADEAARVNAAVEGLPARHAQALYLLFWQGLSMSEAARELGVTKERVRQIRAHALRELRGRLAGGRGDVSSPINEERP